MVECHISRVIIITFFPSSLSSQNKISSHDHSLIPWHCQCSHFFSGCLETDSISSLLYRSIDFHHFLLGAFLWRWKSPAAIRCSILLRTTTHTHCFFPKTHCTYTGTKHWFYHRINKATATRDLVNFAETNSITVSRLTQTYFVIIGAV